MASYSTVTKIRLIINVFKRFIFNCSKAIQSINGIDIRNQMIKKNRF